MSAIKIVGFLSLLLGIAALAFTPRTLGREPVVAGVPVLALVVGAVGVFLAVLGLVFLVRGPTKPAAQPAAAPPPPTPQAVEIKRTEMNWGDEPASAGVPEDQNPALEDVRRRMGKLKVEYGLGKVSPNAYRELMKDLEAEETAILRGERPGDAA